MKLLKIKLKQRKDKIFSFCITLFFALLTTNTVFSNNIQKEIQYLSGTDNENTETWEFFCTGGRKSGYWTTIEVPSHWEQQGFGEYDYGRSYHTYDRKFKYADEKGLYKYTFKIPESWQDKTVNIVFEGSMTDTEVKINGKLAGEIHQGSFYRFKYDITDKLNYNSENVLEVTVSKISSNKSVNHAERYADYWIFGGIFRPVYLEAMPHQHIERVAVAANADGNFNMDVYTQKAGKKAKIISEIIDSNGDVIAEIEQDVNSKSNKTTISGKLENIKPWSAEKPNLYKVKVKLLEKNEEQYTLVEKFGFRTIEIRKGDGIYVNGTKVKLKGINRHVFWPETGRCINPKIDLQDVLLCKEANMNAVRCSHYPPDKTFLEYCDSLGLFVLDELAGWQNAYDTEVGEKLVRELVVRDVNHPSIIFWSNGNEGGTNKDLDDDFDLYDPSKRPVIHAHHRPDNDYNGIDCNHYEDYYSTKKLLEGPNIYMPTEFLHGQDDGGMAAGLYDFWELHWNSKLSGGGFLWTMVDEGIVRTDLNNQIDVDRVNAPDGLLGPHREKEGSFYAMREIFAPVKISTKELPVDFNGSLEIENRFHFTNLNECEFKWEIIDFNLPTERSAGHKSIKGGNFTGGNIPPLAKGMISIPLPNDWKNHDALKLTIVDPYGKERLTWVWKTSGNQSIVKKIIKLNDGEVEVDEKDSMIRLKANGIKIEIDKNSGTLKTLENDFSKPLLFNNGPVLVSGNANIKETRHYKDKDCYTVETTFDGDLKYIKWKMFGSGWVALEYEYQVDGNQPFIGVSFDAPESNIMGVKWLGNGPYRVWKNRLNGVNLDVYKSLYNNTHTGAQWQYPEFKGYFSDIVWMEFNTSEGKFLMVSEEKDLFVRLYDFYSIAGPENHPKLPVGDISFLDGIPPTGTKLATNINTDASRLGPQGELNKMDSPVHRTLYFYFGLPE